MRRLDPTKYPAWYENGGYGFFKQADIDDFRTLVENVLRKREAYHRKQLEGVDERVATSDCSCEAFKDNCYEEAIMSSGS